MDAASLTYQLTHLTGSVGALVPELILTGTFLVMILLELIFGKKNAVIVPIAGMLGLCLALGALCLDPLQEGTAYFLNMIRIDGLSLFFRALFGIVGLLTLGVSMSSNGLKKESRGRGEYYIIVVAMVLGMHLMSVAGNLLMMYLALELVSISSYILTAYTRMNRSSAEASLKYLIYGAFSSGIMIYGISWFYGLTGTLDPSAVNWELADPVLMMVAATMILGGFLFKVSALPFHFWAPDVYEGAPYPVAAFFSVAPKAAGFILMIHFLQGVQNPTVMAGLQHILGIIAIVTMTVGNLSALRQTSFRRMLAFSSIAHAGYLLMGVVCFTHYGNASVMYYLAVYAVMNLTAFWIAGWIEEKWGIQNMEELKGTGSRNPFLTVLITLVMISLTGLPPTAGLTGKIYLFTAVLEQWNTQGDYLFIALLVAAVLNTVLSLFFYLRVPMQMVFGKKEAENTSTPIPKGYMVLAGILGIPLLVLGVWGFDRIFNFFLQLAG